MDDIGTIGIGVIERAQADTISAPPAWRPLDPAKFRDPLVTAKGERRAGVALGALRTLWFNTGTLCNITCANCYIELPPAQRPPRLPHRAPRPAPISTRSRRPAAAPRLIGFTGGEPFMNPDIAACSRTCLARGFSALVLTNAMRPMQLLSGAARSAPSATAPALTLRVSLDHYTRDAHEAERGRRAGSRRSPASLARRQRLRPSPSPGAPTPARAERGVRTATRACSPTGIALDADDPAQLVLFPEMDARGRAGDHRGVLGHPAQIARRFMCASLAHGGEAQGRGSPGRRRLYALALCAVIRARRDARRGVGHGPAQPSALRQILRPRRRLVQPRLSTPARCRPPSRSTSTTPALRASSRCGTRSSGTRRCRRRAASACGRISRSPSTTRSPRTGCRRGSTRFARALSPLAIGFANIGIFVNGAAATIFLGPVADRALLALHEAFHRAFADCLEGCIAHYRPGRWVPHLTLAQDVDLAVLPAAVANLAGALRPAAGRLDVLSVVRYLPVELLGRYTLDG